jgi:hypothetical protein
MADRRRVIRFDPNGGSSMRGTHASAGSTVKRCMARMPAGARGAHESWGAVEAGVRRTHDRHGIAWLEALPRTAVVRGAHDRAGSAQDSCVRRTLGDEEGQRAARATPRDAAGASA